MERAKGQRGKGLEHSTGQGQSTNTRSATQAPSRRPQRSQPRAGRPPLLSSPLLLQEDQPLGLEPEQGRERKRPALSLLPTTRSSCPPAGRPHGAAALLSQQYSWTNPAQEGREVTGTTAQSGSNLVWSHEVFGGGDTTVLLLNLF